MKSTLGSRLASTAALLAFAGCSGRGPAASSRACRTWMLRYSDQNGRTFRCEAQLEDGMPTFETDYRIEAVQQVCEEGP